MPFENRPESVPQGDYADSTVDTNRTVEEWITATVREDGKQVKRAFGFILLPKEEIAWRKKNEFVQDAVTGPGQFDSMGYYLDMLEYQIQETSFGVDASNIRTWLTEANDEILSELEKHAPMPVDVGEDDATGYVDDLIADYVAGEGDPTDSVGAFREWVHAQATGDLGK